MLPSLTEVKRRRVSLGLTQAVLAKKSGVSQSLIAKIENGSTDPVYSKLKMIFDALERIEHETTRTARDVMSTSLFSVASKENMRKVLRLMKSHEISQVPVIDSKRCVGSVSDRTVLRALSSVKNPDELLKLSVSEVMDGPFPLVEPDASLKSVSNLLAVYSAVLVSEESKLVGIITRADLF